MTLEGSEGRDVHVTQPAGSARSWQRDPAILCTDLDSCSVLLDPRTQRVFDLNPTGTVVWQWIDQGVDTAVRQVMASFAVDDATARRDVDVLIAQLAAAGLLVPMAPDEPTV